MPDPAERAPAPAADSAFESLLLHLKETRGFDFTGYKRASLVRRVDRRVQAVGATGYDAYLDHLMVNPDELGKLFDTVLINVTGFFRDPDAWDHLRDELLPGLVRDAEGRRLRAWSAGCASGEEAYTLAMVLAEGLGLEAFGERVKIYATDVDEEALSRARLATYTSRDVEAVPAELREKYFESVGGRFVVRKELRRAVIFGRNDLVQDAPISHVDLLVCRNTLMYFTAEAQARILDRLHFALRPEGYLFLGNAEMLLGHTDTFRPVHLRRRFFTKVAAGRPARERTTPDAGRGVGRLGGEALARLADAALMSASSAQIVLDAENRLALSNPPAMLLCGLTRRDLGRPFQDLEVSYRPVELRPHLAEASESRRSLWLRDVEWPRTNAEPLVVDIAFVALTDDTGARLGTTVLFHDVTRYRQLQHELQVTNRQLEGAYQELQSTVEELETTNEELQSMNEELETTNEELQSTNEELETINEELQSMNDELQFSNQSLHEHQEEVSRLNRFLASVLESLDTGVAVVDDDLCVLAWNARAEELWGVRTGEAVGEHLFDLDIGLPLEPVREALRRRLVDDAAGATSSTLEAVNRRGRPVRVRVTLTPLVDRGADGPAAMLLMDVVDAVDAVDAAG